MHVNYVVNQVTEKLAALIRAKHKNIQIKSGYIRENLTVFIDSVIEDPEFNGQTKECLTSIVGKF